MDTTSPELYVTLEGEGSDEFEEKRSIFIGHAKHVTSEEEAMEFIKSKKKEYSDATHNCWAYLLKGGIIARYSDDGEPQGTAGVPMLEAIRKSGVSDCVVVVTRYFGGTLLGTGGLVRAYSSAANGALKAGNIINYDVYSSLRISVSYSDYQRLGSVFNQTGFNVDEIKYTDKVIIYGRILKELLGEFDKAMIEATAGRHESELLGDKFDYLKVN